MSLSSALARIELDYLGNPARPCAHTLHDLDHVSTLQEDGVGGGFEKSLRVKGMLDELEAAAKTRPAWKILAAVVTSEYRLWVLNADTPLRLNPFLSHWVEAVQRLEADAKTDGARAADGLSAGDIAATRLELIKRLLGGKDMDVLSTASPQQLYESRSPSTPFDVQPYIRMLEEEGIYEPSTSPATTVSPPTADEPRQPPKLTFEAWKSNIQARLDTDPSSVVEDLTHLPIALPALDFLTTTITHGSLAAHGIDPRAVTTSYIQHALRLIEYMGQPGPSASTSGSAGNLPPRQTDVGIATDTDRGREAQSRAVRLLLLFMKNLIKRGVVSVQPGDEGPTLYFEIQEICVRFVWMREVREFRTWIDRGGG